ncbi:hypothetical protein KUTeg_015937 [Tegillarca granosa]|uniref:Uncharacterized protein n=1 Tax=Tegillarca granosa TaxID=220873 RepID=A0ABQ9EJD5_TEGGR|nr:hypothetical protein KUTeg_015937 [Tegillarca granosa]
MLSESSCVESQLDTNNFQLATGLVLMSMNDNTFTGLMEIKMVSFTRRLHAALEVFPGNHSYRINVNAGRRVIDLFEDLKDGHNLISLLEVLAKDTLPRERGK